MLSSHTSYSNETHHPPPDLVHWARHVFDGQHPCTPFYPRHQFDDSSSSHGDIEPSSPQDLSRDNFTRVLQLPFDEEQLWLRLYWRPPDNRARILIMTIDGRGRLLHSCQPLTNLRIIRRQSILRLCRVREGGRYRLWAQLNFRLYERMVLFYCTFVAMKHQDRRHIPHPGLFDSFELAREDGEAEIFGGEIRHGDLRHALRLFKDRGSGVVRLDACALRGPMQDVPLWTAFVTRYVGDPDWVQYEGQGVVSLVALRPPPYVFLAGFQPLRNRRGEYVLQFVTDDGTLRYMTVSRSS